MFYNQVAWSRHEILTLSLARHDWYTSYEQSLISPICLCESNLDIIVLLYFGACKYPVAEGK